MEAATITARFMADTSGLIQGAQQASQSLQQVATAQTDMGKSAVSATAGVKALGMAMKALIATAVISFFRSAINSFEESEVASRKLTAALKNNASVAQTSQSEWEELASDVQDYSRFSDEAATATIALYANMGLTEDQVRTLLPLTADLAERLGTDMESAALKVTRAMSGSARSLQSAGINMTGLTDAADKTTFTIERLTEQVGGFARAAEKDASFQLDQLSNAFDDFKENLGRAVLPVLTAVVSNGLKPLAEVLQNIPQPALMVGAALAGVGAALKVAQGVAPVVAGSLKTMGSFLSKLVPGMGSFTSETEDAAGSQMDFANSVTGANTSIQSNISRLSLLKATQQGTTGSVGENTAALMLNTDAMNRSALAMEMYARAQGVAVTSTQSLNTLTAEETVMMNNLTGATTKSTVATEQQALAMGNAARATTSAGAAVGTTTKLMTGMSRALGVIGVIVGIATAAWTAWNMVSKKQNDEIRESEKRVADYRNQLRGLATDAAAVANASDRWTQALRGSTQLSAARGIALTSVFEQLRSDVEMLGAGDWATGNLIEKLGIDDPSELGDAVRAYLDEGFKVIEEYGGARRAIPQGPLGEELFGTREVGMGAAAVTGITEAQYDALGKLATRYEELKASELDTYFFEVARSLKVLNSITDVSAKGSDRLAKLLSAAQRELRTLGASIGGAADQFLGLGSAEATAEGLQGYQDLMLAQAQYADANTALQNKEWGFFGIDEAASEQEALAQAQKAVEEYGASAQEAQAELERATQENVEGMISAWHQWRDQTTAAFDGVDMALGEFVGKTKVNLDNVIESQERVITLQKNFTEDLLEVAETAPKAFIDWAREQGLAVAGLIGSLADAGKGQREEFFENWRKQQGLGKGITDVFQEALVGTTKAIRDLIRAIKGIPEWEAIPRNIKSADDFNRRLDIMKRKMIDQSGMELAPNLADKAVEGLAEAEAGADRAREAADRLSESMYAMPGMPDKLNSSMEVFAGVSDTAATAVQSVADALGNLPPTVGTTYELNFAIRGLPPEILAANPELLAAFSGHTGGLMTDKGFKRMHWGGLASDERPAILQVGEFVMQRKAVDRYGEDFFQALNRGLPSMSTNQGPTPIRLDLRVEPIIDRDRIAREHTRAVTYTGL